MGSNDEYYLDEIPIHKVYLDAYYMDKYEVTNAQFCEFLNEKGNQGEDGVTCLDINDEDCLIEYRNGRYQLKSRYENHPAIYVTWYGARVYAKWAGKRLPTEAEWEKAARGGLVGKRYSWGDRDPDGSQCNFADKSFNRYSIDETANDPPDHWNDKTANDGYGRTVPVGTYLPNGYGLYDMAGNVWDWCFDLYDANYYAKSPVKNPQGADHAPSYGLRGGG